MTPPPPFPPGFHPATVAWFAETLGTPTPAQARGWRAIAAGRHTLIAAPTGAGKTLAAFLSAIDELVREAEAGPLPDETRIVYVSPLKALGNDIDRNLAAPLAAIAERCRARGTELRITTAVRTGDTSAAARARMVRVPPHILVTTPEGLYALVTSEGGRSMLGRTRVVIVDEIHALAPDRRGAHLALTLERLEALVGRPLQRIGLSATQKPVEEVARFLVGGDRPCEIVDEGHVRERDLRIEVPGSPLGAVMENEVWDELFERIAELVRAHRTTLVFVNSRRLCERVAHRLGERLGADRVAAHHGSLAPPLRHHAEARLKAGDLKALVATASLELGIDIGDVDLVVQLGSVKRIAILLQRVGRANHRHGGIPKGRLFPLTLDELVEAVALVRCVEAGELDRLEIPDHPLDVLAQQVVAAAVTGEWDADALFGLVRRAHPYRALERADFDALLAMLADGFPTERGRRGRLLHLDRVNGTVSARRGARMTALSSGGTIPDGGDYKVRLEPQGVVVGAVAEDFAIHQLPGHVIQLGSNSWRILGVRAGEVRVEPAPGEAPYLPVWFGEVPARSRELSAEVSRLRAEVAAAATGEEAAARLSAHPWLDASAAGQLVEYLASIRDALGRVPTAEAIVAERFTDRAGGEQLVVHAPLGVRVTRAWALALRHRFGRLHGVEIQATATDDGFLLSLPGTARFPLGELWAMVRAADAEALVAEATLDVPMFMVRWRWAAARALLVPRLRGGRRVPPHIQRTDAEELLLTVFPHAAVGRPLRQEAREGGLRSPLAAAPAAHPLAVPEQPLLRQTLADCLHEAMDVRGLVALLRRIEAGEVAVRAVDRLHPSPAALGVSTARPPAFLDGGALMDRRTRNIDRGPRHLAVQSETRVHPEALERIRAEVAPDLRSAEDLATHLSLSGVLTAEEVAPVRSWMEELEAAGRARPFRGASGAALWAAADRLPELAAAFPALLSAAAGAAAADPEAALARVLGGRLETSGPVTADEVAAALDVPPALARAALDRLVAEGHALRGAFDPARPDEPTWCERRVLSRIERLTRNRLRAEVEPVTLRDFVRFLLRWHGLTPGERRRGRDGLERTLEMLDGVELPAAAWEGGVLHARVDGFDPADLNELCLSGRFGWGRISPPAATDRAPKLTRATPIAFWELESGSTWRRLAAGGLAPPPLSPHADALLRALDDRGPSFLAQIERAVPIPPFQREKALIEGVAAGRITADGAVALRILLERPEGYGVSRLDLLARAQVGRWSVLPPPEPITDPVEREAATERLARTLLRRYGVVVRGALERETVAVPWRDLLRVLRRMEARGEVRGGFFVDGSGGEHFALPEALPLLREIRAHPPAGERVRILAADPLNLTGWLSPGPRVPARTTTTLVLEDGLPVAVEERDRVIALPGPPIASGEPAPA